jgi:hypothetical protein
MTEESKPVCFMVEVETLTRWHDELLGVAYPKVSFDEKKSGMRKQALKEAHRVAMKVRGEMYAILKGRGLE